MNKFFHVLKRGSDKSVDKMLNKLVYTLYFIEDLNQRLIVHALSMYIKNLQKKDIVLFLLILLIMIVIQNYYHLKIFLYMIEWLELDHLKLINITKLDLLTCTVLFFSYLTKAPKLAF